MIMVKTRKVLGKGE